MSGLSKRRIGFWLAPAGLLAVVVSPIPFVWENFGRFSLNPEYRARLAARDGPTYFHFGLVSHPRERPTGVRPLECVPTEQDAVCLFRLR